MEKGKSQFVGPELQGKTLGVVGLGAIGVLVANAGGAVLLPEGESSGEKLYALMTGLLSDAPRREAMSRALRDMAVPDAAEQIYQTLVRLMEKRAN